MMKGQKGQMHGKMMPKDSAQRAKMMQMRAMMMRMMKNCDSANGKGMMMGQKGQMQGKMMQMQNMQGMKMMPKDSVQRAKMMQMHTMMMNMMQKMYQGKSMSKKCDSTKREKMMNGKAHDHRKKK